MMGEAILQDCTNRWPFQPSSLARNEQSIISVASHQRCDEFNWRRTQCCYGRDHFLVSSGSCEFEDGSFVELALFLHRSNRLPRQREVARGGGLPTDLI